MARIRTIKPEFWTSEQVAECSPTTRLLFLGLLNFCDDNGIHPASFKRIKMEVFPSDPISEQDLRLMIGELINVGLLDQYEVSGMAYLLVTGWLKHQKIEKPTYRHPLPDGSNGVQFSETARRQCAERSSNIRRKVADRSTPEWNGMESKGENLPIQAGKLPTLLNIPKGGSENSEEVSHAQHA